MKQLKFALFISATVYLTGCSGAGQTNAGETSDSTIAVTLSKPALSNPVGVTAAGQVEARQTAAISTRLMGAITHLYVKLGDHVRQGQELVTIAGADLDARRAQADAQIAGARADLENAKKDYDRYTVLFNKQSATASELDNATLRYQAARSRLETAQQMRKEVDASMAYTRLTAPFSGTVTQKLADEGSMATPGMPILTLEQDGVLQVSATIAESDIARIRTGDKARLTIGATGLTAEGTITQVGASSTATGGQYPIKIGLPPSVQKSLLAGMYVNVLIPESRRPQQPQQPQHPQQPQQPQQDAVFVPLSALVERDQLTGLYTISNSHKAILRWVRTGKRAGDHIEVLSGLGPEETFILHASGRLYNGAPVREN